MCVYGKWYQGWFALECTVHKSLEFAKEPPLERLLGKKEDTEEEKNTKYYAGVRTLLSDPFKPAEELPKEDRK